MMNLFVFLLNKSNSLTISNDTLKISLPSQFMKIGLGKIGNQKLIVEYSNLQFFYSTILTDLIPRSTLERKLFWKVLKLEFLQPAERKLETAKIVYEKFNSLASPQELGNEIIPFLKSKIQNTGMNTFLSEIEEKQILIGPIHGDFHLNNIMRTNSGDLKVIDLDLSMRNWIRQFDLINVFVSEYILTQGLLWKEAFEATWRSEDDLALLDESWSKYSCYQKKIHFYLYYVKRTIDESVVFTSEEHLKLLNLLELS